MSLVKIYRYHIKPDTELEYIELQEEAIKIYREYGEMEFTFLRDSKNPLKRTEMIRILNDNAEEILKKIDQDSRVQALFKEFSTDMLDTSAGPIDEEILHEETLSSSGKIHHVEIYCSNLEKSAQFWGWFLGELGYKQYQKWRDGISFKLGDSYLVFVQADKKHVDTPFHRCKPGLNHLAFHASTPAQVDLITKKLKERGISMLYEDKHPHAGGPESYGVYFEDSERIKVELCAP